MATDDRIRHAEADYEQLTGLSAAAKVTSARRSGVSAALEWRAGVRLRTPAKPGPRSCWWSARRELRLRITLLEIGDAVAEGEQAVVVPPRSISLAFDRILIAWKDSAEARRALPAALPLLKQAKELVIVEIASDEDARAAANERLADVAKWLQRHNVPASARVELSARAPGSQLEAIASEARADIIVAGAYGHSRLSEWIFSGVTRHLLQHSLTCTLLVH